MLRISFKGFVSFAYEILFAYEIHECDYYKGKSVCSETRATSVRVKQTSEITSYSTYTFKKKKKKKYVLIKL